MAKYQAPIRPYELVIVYDSDLNEEQVKEELKKVEETIMAHKGTVIKTDLWGRRQLAYQINKKGYGFYVVLVIQGDNQMVADLERQLRINEQVLRSLCVKKDQFAPDLSEKLKEAPGSFGGRERRGGRDDRFSRGDRGDRGGDRGRDKAPAAAASASNDSAEKASSDDAKESAAV